MNKIILMGRMTANPELKVANTNKNYLFYTIAVARNKEITDFINCVAWEKSAQIINDYCKKGSKILIEGRLLQRKNDKNENIYEVNTIGVTLLDNKITETTETTEK